jgi:ketosteroid isomerase-like protein
VSDQMELVERFNAAWNDHNLDAVMAMCADDIVFESAGPSPDGVRAAGQVAVRATWAPIFSNAKSHFDQEEVFEANDRVVQRWSYSWGDGHLRGVDVFRVRDGLIVEKLSYVKCARGVRASGAQPG